MSRYAYDNGSTNDDDFAYRFPASADLNDEMALDAATAHVDHSSGKPTTPATRAKMASRILKNAADGVTDAHKLRSVAIEEGLCPAD